MTTEEREATLPHPGEWLADLIAATTTEELFPNPFRCSVAGFCARRLGYMAAAEHAPPLPWRSVLRFRLGDQIHQDLQALLPIEEPEATVQLDIPRRDGGALTLTGHVDGFLTLDGTRYFLEIKSMAELSFKGLKYGFWAISKDYQDQHEMYRRATGHPGLYLLYNKNTSDVRWLLSEPNEEAWERVVERYNRLYEEFLVNESGLEEPPETLREFDPEPEKKGKKLTGRLVLPWNCSYCDYCDKCWPEAKLEFKSGKPVLVINA